MDKIQVSQEIAEERMKTCLGCEFVRVYDSPNSIPEQPKVNPIQPPQPFVNKVLSSIDSAMLWALGVQCSICKCGMHIKTKLNGTSCPKGKWRR